MAEDVSNTMGLQLHDNFWHFMRVRFDSTKGLPLTLFFGFASILTATTNSFFLGVILFFGLCLVLATYTFYRAADDLYFINKNLQLNKLPSVIEVRKNDMCNDGAIALCLLSPSDLFSFNALVTFYYFHEGYERPIGFGEVVNIQDTNKIIQVELNYILKGQEEIVEKLIQNNANCLRKVYIKPIILKKYFKLMREWW